MLEPTLFADDVANYPIDWSNAIPSTFKMIEEQDPDSIYFNSMTGYQTTLSHITYLATEYKTQLVSDFEKMIFSMESFWLKTAEFGYGINKDVFEEQKGWHFFDQ